MTPFFNSIVVIVIVACLSVICQANPSKTEDIHIPENCVAVAKLGDHVLFHYTSTYQNGTDGPSIRTNNQPFYLLLPELEDSDGLYTSIVGMCEGSTRRLIYDNLKESNIQPVIPFTSTAYALEESFTLNIHLHHITTTEDYQIFDALRAANISLVLDLIDEHKGINSMDEYGQTPLMIAVARQYPPVIAALLNTRRPKVEINLVKANGFSALFYAVEKAVPGILQALLRRGADPNLVIQQEGTSGNTPLHYACLLEKVKHAELLLEYGANPYIKNEHGQIPYQMIPSNAVPSARLKYRTMFEDAYKKIELAKSTGSAEEGSAKAEL